MRFILVLLVFCSFLFGAVVEDMKQIKALEMEIIEANKFLDNTNNMWMKRYSNYWSYQQVLSNLSQTQDEILNLEKQPKTLENRNRLNLLERNLAALEQQKNVLDIYKDTPFGELTQAKELEVMPNVTNPFLIVRAYAYIKKADTEIGILKRNYKSLEENINQLMQKDSALKALLQVYTAAVNQTGLQNLCSSNYCLYANEKEILKAYQENLNALTVLETTKEVFQTTLEIFTKEVEENK